MNTEENQEKGFTLVELLIVIVILGILSTIVVFSVRGLTGKANKNACKIDGRSLQTAFESAYADTGSYPADEAALVADGYMQQQSSKWVATASSAGVLSFTPVSPCLAADAPI
jgi:prepilin-type N-terminal cleavage/methylation domain-containing protein